MRSMVNVSGAWLKLLHVCFVRNCLSTSLLQILDTPLNMNVIVVCSACQENMHVTVRAKSRLYACMSCQSIDNRVGKMDWKRPYIVYDKL